MITETSTKPVAATGTGVRKNGEFPFFILTLPSLTSSRKELAPEEKGFPANGRID
jgi:hypothetical protein